MFRSLDAYPLKQYKNKLKVLCLSVIIVCKYGER